MGMPAAHPVSTIDELLALPTDGLRHELLDGDHVVTPAPRLAHQAVVGEIYLALTEAVRGRADLRVFTSPADVVLGPRTLVQPDVFVIRQDPASPVKEWSEVRTLALAVEVLSPATAARDRLAKRRIYQRAAVAEYWIVDPDARLVERWTPDDDRPEIADVTLTWNPADGVETGLDLPALFQKAGGS
ncbi:MAG: Uma2 family endonuclease [Gemmatimonadota bacterium]|nr:Uma2 family endonuclease [Gemmatimonadota bacterium]MDH3368703.1 Uma2 family endonuclease [Gemmatimonadota bacterium]MDH3479638.1 Uma2 family endonuclease [Gemmatimonadota bacterium]MDH5549499.1 Uma2 family endonuclease [Gemmatimonadota bacterium]